MNRFAASQIRGEFATNLIAIFAPEHQSMSYSTAGHLPALLLPRRDRRGDPASAGHPRRAFHRLTNARNHSNLAFMPSPVRALTGSTVAVGLTSRTRAT